MNKSKTLLAVLIFLGGINGISAHGDAHVLIQKLTLQIQSDQNNPELYFNRAVLYQSDGDFNASFLDYQKVKDLDPDLAIVNRNLSELCLSNDLGKMALSYADEYLIQRPDEAKAWVTRGKVYSYLAQFDRALEDYINALNSTEVIPDYYFEISEIILKKDPGDYKTAVAWLKKGQDEIGRLTGFSEKIIELEIASGNTQNGLAELEILIDRSARKEKWYAQQGEILYQAGRLDEAEQSFIKAKAAINKLSAARKNTDYIRELESRIDLVLSLN